MTGPDYPEAMRRFGIAVETPDEPDRERIDAIIFEELVNGVLARDACLLAAGVGRCEDGVGNR